MGGGGTAPRENQEIRDCRIAHTRSLHTHTHTHSNPYSGGGLCPLTASLSLSSNPPPCAECVALLFAATRQSVHTPTTRVPPHAHKWVSHHHHMGGGGGWPTCACGGTLQKPAYMSHWSHSGLPWPYRRRVNHASNQGVRLWRRWGRLLNLSSSRAGMWLMPRVA